MEMYGMPECVPVQSGQEAIELAGQGGIDFVLTDFSAGDMSWFELGEALKEKHPGLPVFLLTSKQEFAKPLRSIPEKSSVTRIFAWLGDTDVLKAITLLAEDDLNLERDMAENCRLILLVEDEPHFYSYYLPHLYRLLLRKTWGILSSVKKTDASDRRSPSRARVALVDSFDDAQALIEKYQANMLGVITDLQYTKGGNLELEAGIALTRLVKSLDQNIPVLLQSGHSEIREAAERAGATFLWKDSNLLMTDLKKFMMTRLGFGDFVFRSRDGAELSSVSSLDELIQEVRTIPIDSLEFHASRNHFSTWLYVHGEPELASVMNPIHEKGEKLRSLVLSALTARPPLPSNG
jgi:CheY-like chemotaxis protein